MPLATTGHKISVKQTQTTTTTRSPAAAAAQPALDNKSGRLSALPSKAVGEALSVPQMQQGALNWCWAGCCAMLVKFLHDKEVRQCQMANELFGQQACCS